MTAPLRVLTFARHEPYLCLLAKTGHVFDVYEPYVPSLGKVRRWMPEFRPVPANVRLVSEDTMRTRLRTDAYDVVVCHDGADLAAVLPYDVPKVLLFHTRLNWSEDQVRVHGMTRDQIRDGYDRVIADPAIQVAFVSTSKRDSWRLACNAHVIPPGIDLEDYGGFAGELPAALRVGNEIMENLTHGAMKLMYVTWGFPLQIIGNNALPHARPSRSWDDLRQQLRSHRVYVHTTEEAYEDGYNLSLLEAMATGMPIIATANATSPIVDGRDGFISDDLTALRDRLGFLLAHPEEARRLGANARRTVAEHFALPPFVDAWTRLLRHACGSSTEAHGDAATIRADGAALLSASGDGLI